MLWVFFLFTLSLGQFLLSVLSHYHWVRERQVFSNRCRRVFRHDSTCPRGRLRYERFVIFCQFSFVDIILLFLSKLEAPRGKGVFVACGMKLCRVETFFLSGTNLIFQFFLHCDNSISLGNI